MICPKCKGKNQKQDIVCRNCGLKLKKICPRCKKPNPLGQTKCAHCNLLLIRFCPECKAPNFPHTKNCRKCGFELLKKKPEVKPAEVVEQKTPSPEIKKEEIKEKEENIEIELKKELTRNESVKALTNIITKSDKGYLISLCAPEGLGKSTIISSIAHSLKDQKITWLNGICEPYKQQIPYSFFKDLISSLFGIPIISLNNDEIKKSIKKIFETNLGITDQSILKIVHKIVLNEHGEYDNSIEKNREHIHKALQEIISAFNAKSRLVLIVDDFEYIDKASFDCIKYLLKKGFLDNKNFLIINHTPSTNIAKLFPAEISLQQLLILVIKPLSNPELDSVMLSMLNNQDILPEDVKSKIFRQSKGLSIYVEQALWYLFQLGAIYPEQNGLTFKQQYKDVDINPDLHGLFMQRFALIERGAPETIKVILTATLLGVKFIPKLLETATGIKEKEMQQIMQLLVNSGIFTVYDQFNFGFKHICIWKIIFERVFNDQQIKETGSNLLSVLQNNSSIRNSLLVKLAEYAEDSQNLIHYYNNAAKESFSLGDTLSYTNNMVKLLEMADEEEKSSIAAQIGKVNFESNPTLAINYLKQSIKKQEELDNKVKVVELIGYLSRSCELSGNYQEVLDCTEKAVDITTELEEDNTSEITLLNFSKLEALFNLGRLEETIMTAENEILPFLRKAISKNETIPGLNTEELKEIEYQTEFILAKALTYQGNSKAGDLLKKIATKAEKENNNEYRTKAFINQALFLTIQGDLRSSDEVLEKLTKKDLDNGNSDQLQLEWLFITTLSHMLEGSFDKARNLCYSALPLAKECKDYNLFAILKLLNGFFYQHFQHFNNAIAIYDEVACYCAETKMATGALFSWYFAAEAELQTGNPERAEELAEKALDISKKPNINNYIAAILLSKLIAETKTIKGDFEGAQIYIENGIELAEKNKLSYALVELYLTFGKIYQENATAKKENKENSSNHAYRLFTKALSMAEKLDNNFIITRVEKEISNLETFCKLSGVTLGSEA